MKKISLILLIFSFLSSCSTYEEKTQKNLKTVWRNHFKKNFDQTQAVDVFVVTNRKAKSDTFACTDAQFGVDADLSLKYGFCQISVPKNHNIGDIELAKDAQQSAQNYFKILGAKSLQEQDLIAALKQSNRTPLVFVHGFNVRYQEAVLRAAQIAYDLKYQGQIILFTWPAGAGTGFFDDQLLNKTYANNLVNARASVTLFKNFLLDMQKSGIKINLVVHSMGHQVVLPALQQIAEANYKKPLINQLILNAPDFEINEFRSSAKNITKTSEHVTLYCSYNDKAMMVSKTFNSSERLGACTFLDDVDVINVSSIDDSALGLGHGYYSSRAILNDVFQTLLGIDVNQRLFIAKGNPNASEKYFLRK